jgi:plasmid stabilization system protein ParE
LNYFIHPDAEAELGDAAEFYAANASPKIANAFLTEFERVVELLIENQQRGPHGEEGLRNYHFNRFPFTVIYEEDKTLGPQIFAVAHQSREPGYWYGRLERLS